jgi:transcriptional regulator of arginine metabolism
MATTVVPGGSNAKRRRQRAILDLVARGSIGSQDELVERLREAGFEATQATVSRDATDLGLVKVPRGDRHVYALPEEVASIGMGDSQLRRLLEDIPVRVARSGLSLVLVATPGSAGAIAQAIDRSSLGDQLVTLAGDDTRVVLFGTEAALERWLVSFGACQPAGTAAPPAGRPLPDLEAPR